MGGIQTEVTPETSKQNQPLTAEHLVELDAICKNVEGLISKLRTAKTYGEVKNAFREAEEESEIIVQAGLSDVLESFEDEVKIPVAAQVTDHEGDAQPE